MKQTSSDEWANSGYGLYMASKICGYLDGSFCIISDANYLRRECDKSEGGTTSFQGTAISMRVKPTRIKNASGIISQILAQGEIEARTIRSAFQKASTPSRELLNRFENK